MISECDCFGLPPSMSDEEQESGCDTVDGSPASDSSGQNESPFMESRYVSHGNHGNQNREPRPARIAPATEPCKPAVRTMVVPPMRVHNNNSIADEHAVNTGDYTPTLCSELVVL